jgi:hypothetical protein
VAEKARRVEALGYDLLGVADHLTDGRAQCGSTPASSI